MFEVKYLVKNDIDNLDRVFDTEKEMNEWIKSAKDELVIEKFNSLVLAKLNVPFVNTWQDTNVYIVKFNNASDYEAFKAWNDLVNKFGEDYTEEPLNYPCIEFLIETESYIEFASGGFSAILNDFSKVVSVLTDINSKENGKE